MKHVLSALRMGVLIVLWVLPFRVAEAQSPAAERGERSIQEFMRDLNAYGDWFTMGEWGWAWQPHDISPWWVPYTEGEWSYTTSGPYWTSYKPYGWAVFHYGRWMLVEERGWVWIPDTTWGPGFVCWREGKGYLGWAPMPPDRPHSMGAASGECSVPPEGWSFILARSAFFRNVEPYILPRARGINMLRVTQPLTNYVEGGLGWIDKSIPRAVLQDLTGLTNPVQPTQLVTSPLAVDFRRPVTDGVPGGPNAVNVYAPLITGTAPPPGKPFQLNMPPAGARPAIPPVPAGMHPAHRAATNADAMRLAHERLMDYQHVANVRMRMMHDHDMSTPPWREFPPEDVPQWHIRELHEQALQDMQQRRWIDARFAPAFPQSERPESASDAQPSSAETDTK